MPIAWWQKQKTAFGKMGSWLRSLDRKIREKYWFYGRLYKNQTDIDCLFKKKFTFCEFLFSSRSVGKQILL